MEKVLGPGHCRKEMTTTNTKPEHGAPAWRPYSRLHRTVRASGRGPGVGALAGSARPGALHPAAGGLASFPSVLVTALTAFGVIPASLGLAVGGAILLLLLNALGWRITSVTFQRERLISGTR